MLSLIAAMLLETATPTPEAVALGKRLAASGAIAAMIPMVVEKDLADLAGEDKTLTPAEQDRLKAIGHACSAAGLDKLTSALGQAYAEKLSVADLRVLVAQNELPAVGRWHAIEPAALIQAIQALGQVDLKKETAAAFCQETGKLCKRR